MASINNNSARKYSIAVTVDGEPRILKIMPGLNTDLSDREVQSAAALDYVQVLADNGTFTINTGETVAPPEPDPEPERAPEEPEEVPEPEPEPEPDPEPERAPEEPEEVPEPEPEPEPEKPKKRKPRKKKSKF